MCKGSCSRWIFLCCLTETASFFISVSTLKRLRRPIATTTLWRARHGSQATLPLQRAMSRGRTGADCHEPCSRIRVIRAWQAGRVQCLSTSCLSCFCRWYGTVSCMRRQNIVCSCRSTGRPIQSFGAFPKVRFSRLTLRSTTATRHTAALILHSSAGRTVSLSFRRIRAFLR